MKAQEIRETFLDFFARKNHKIVQSSSLLPQDDPSILFTNAGMNQFKNVFLGLDNRSYQRAASVQKCMRVSGKHNDLDQVGKSRKHHTFFEMLGNFSFGDYFKKQAIEYAWELITGVYKMDENRLHITVYEEDDEAFDVWNKVIGAHENKIYRMGKKDNYWSMGDTGPCGPCSEIHYDLEPHGEQREIKKLIEGGNDRYVELWNLVFMQYNQEENGQIHPLPSPSVDTGMGLERMAAVLQHKTSNFETDLFFPIIESIAALGGWDIPSTDEELVPFRIIADHARAVSFLISDGIMPANEGRGYILRRLIRRAYRAGNSLGFQEPFLYKLVSVVSDIMKDSYPELLSSVEHVTKVCLSEEKRFAMTLTAGIKIFDQYIREAKKASDKVLSGKKLFKLYDTFGFPLDLSKEFAEEENMDVDERGFFQELEKQRTRARLSWKGKEKEKESKAYEALKGCKIRFIGYEKTVSTEAEVIALMRGKKKVNELKEGDKGEIFLNETPFYAEAGGQVGDTGVLKNPHFSALVETAYYPIPDIISHKVQILSGAVHEGDRLETSVEPSKRKSISKNHTATHLLHASLRQILGDHVKQAGSFVSPTRLRFDFTHFSPLSPYEWRGIETLVNEKIQENIPVETKVTTLEQGIKEGALAVFEEKYRENVRVVTINGFSKELCGGVHVANTGQIGLFKIIAENSIAAGMRRIEALTGDEAVKYVQKNEEILLEIQKSLNSPQKNLPDQIDKLIGLLKEKEKEAKALRRKIAGLETHENGEAIHKIKGISVLVKKVDGLSDSELRELADSFKQKIGSGIIILGTLSKGKVLLIATITKDLTQKVHADNLIKKVAPLVGGGGGGRPDFAQAGGSKPDKLDYALEQSLLILNQMIRE